VSTDVRNQTSQLREL